MLCKNVVYSGLRLEVSAPFDFQVKIKSVPLSFLTATYQVFLDTQKKFSNPLSLVKYILPKKKL